MKDQSGQKSLKTTSKHVIKLCISTSGTPSMLKYMLQVHWQDIPPIILFIYTAWPLVDGALLVSKRGALPQTVC